MNEMNNAIIYESLGVIKQTLRNHKNHGLKQDRMIANLAKAITRNNHMTNWKFLAVGLSLTLIDAHVKHHRTEIDTLKKEVQELKNMKGE